MASQFAPSHHDQSSGQPLQVSTSPPQTCISNDWIANQSLFMGSSTPLYRRQVSLSPQDPHQVISGCPIIPSFQGPPINTSTSFSGRSMYPSPVYHNGNPGYYYVPFQFPNGVASQTYGTIHNVQSHPTPPYDIPMPAMPTPSNNIFLFDNGEELLPSHQLLNSSNNSPEQASLLSPRPISFSSPILNMNFDDINNNKNHLSSFLHPTLVRDAGCQPSYNTTSPVIIKEVKKLTISHFNPKKRSWSLFGMKLHASLIECNLAYLLR